MQVMKAQQRQVMVPIWDEDLQKKVSVPGIQKIFNEPVPIEGRRDFGFAIVSNQPKHETLDLLPVGEVKEISTVNLLKIANSFGIKQVKIKEWRNGKGTKAVRYDLEYGEKALNWNDDALDVQDTIPSNLEYTQVMCYGTTTYDAGNCTIVHTKPISK